MTNRIFTSVTLFASLGVGVGLAILAQTGGDRSEQQDDAHSITGVTSGAAGTDSQDPEEQGVQQIPPDTPVSTDERQDTATEEAMQAKFVDNPGVQGTDGTTTEAENVIEIVTTTEGSVQSIRGIKGIDSVMLQNLETVLRMQEPPPPPEDSGGGVRAAAALLTMENDEENEFEEVVDGRDELLEFELEGS